MDFKVKIEEEKNIVVNNLLIVDFFNICFRYKHKKQKVFAQDAINTVRSLAKSYRAKDVVIAGDWGSSWRKEIYPEYKGNRAALREKQTEQESQEFEVFVEEVNKAIEMLREIYIVFRFKGVEADDIAAFIATRCHKHYSHVWLVSTDKDWDLLINEKTSRFSYVSRKEVTIENWRDHYDYKQEDHISVKVLQGDSGDNIFGVEGVGIKRAIELVNTYGTAYDIYTSLPITSNYKYIKNLNDFGDKIFLNYELMDLETYCTYALGEENCITIREVFDD